MTNFCNKNVTVEAWYTLCKSKEIKRGDVKKFSVGSAWFAVRRFRNGQLVISDRYCPHMGTDLTLSQELPGQKFRCVFHRLEFNANGNCSSRGAKDGTPYRLATYPVKEKYGLVWVYMGTAPRYEIPELHLDGGFLLQLPSKKITAHHHIVICNPLDSVHVEPVHSLEIHTQKLERTDVHLKSTITGVYRSWWMALLSRVYSKDMRIEFSSHGSSVSVVDANWHKTRVVILFTARQDENNKCSTNTAIWMNTINPLDWLRALTVILIILKQDVDILSSINIKTNFSESDKGMIAFCDVVNSMPVYTTTLRDT